MEVRSCGAAEMQRCGGAEVRRCGGAEVRRRGMFAKSDRKFGGSDTIYSGSIASLRSGNERFVNVVSGMESSREDSMSTLTRKCLRMCGSVGHFRPISCMTLFHEHGVIFFIFIY